MLRYGRGMEFSTRPSVSFALRHVMVMMVHGVFVVGFGMCI